MRKPEREARNDMHTKKWHILLSQTIEEFQLLLFSQKVTSNQILNLQKTA